MEIVIKTIPHNEQRYETPGDWWWDENGIQIRTSNTGSIAQDTLLIVHELVESLLCLCRGITQEQVDKFDLEYENNRKEGNEDEPGDDSNAPYKKEHCLATGIERILASELSVDWSKYADQIESFTKL